MTRCQELSARELCAMTKDELATDEARVDML